MKRVSAAAFFVFVIEKRAANLNPVNSNGMPDAFFVFLIGEALQFLLTLMPTLKRFGRVASFDLFF